MSKYKNFTPEGFQDLMFPQSYRKKRIEEKIRRIFKSFNYLENETPTLEYYDVFDEEVIKTESVYKCFDFDGRILVLKPDLTVPMARVAGTKLLDNMPPIRVSYMDKVFRTNENYGRQKEIAQAGIELIGTRNSRADAEVISIAIEGILASGLKEFQVDIGQVGFFKGLLERENLNSQEIDTLKDYIDKKDCISLKKFLKNRQISTAVTEILLKLPSLYGSVDIIDELKEFSLNNQTKKSIENIEEVIEILYQKGYGKYISIDLGMVKRLNYYTGIIFRGFTYGTGYPILSGGRYDDLIKNYGADLPAVGGCINITELIIALERQNMDFEYPNCEIIFSSNQQSKMKMYKLLKVLREKNYIIEEDIFDRDLDAVIMYAKKKEMKTVVFFEEEDIVLVNLIDKSKKNMNEKELLRFLEENRWNI